jgi:hypothetical protein
LVLWGHFTRGVGSEIAAIAACALGPTIVWQCISGILLGLGEVRLWNWIQLLPPLLTLLGIVLLVVAAIYFALCSGLSGLSRRLEPRDAEPAAVSIGEEDQVRVARG